MSCIFRPLNSTSYYYPNEDQWEEGPEMSNKRDYAASAVVNNVLYVCGGEDYINYKLITLDTCEYLDLKARV